MPHSLYRSYLIGKSHRCIISTNYFFFSFFSISITSTNYKTHEQRNIIRKFLLGMQDLCGPHIIYFVVCFYACQDVWKIDNFYELLTYIRN